jgi:hypothetical protein
MRLFSRTPEMMALATKRRRATGMAMKIQVIIGYTSLQIVPSWHSRDSVRDHADDIHRHRARRAVRVARADVPDLGVERIGIRAAHVGWRRSRLLEATANRLLANRARDGAQYGDASAGGCGVDDKIALDDLESRDAGGARRAGRTLRPGGSRGPWGPGGPCGPGVWASVTPPQEYSVAAKPMALTNNATLAILRIFLPRSKQRSRADG